MAARQGRHGQNGGSRRASQTSPGRGGARAAPSAQRRNGSTSRQRSSPWAGSSPRAAGAGRSRAPAPRPPPAGGAISAGGAGWSSQPARRRLARRAYGRCPGAGGPKRGRRGSRSRAIGRSVSSGSGRERHRQSRPSPGRAAERLLVDPRELPRRRCRWMIRSWHGRTTRNATSQTPAPAHHSQPGRPPRTRITARQADEGEEEERRGRRRSGTRSGRGAAPRRRRCRGGGGRPRQGHPWRDVY